MIEVRLAQDEVDAVLAFRALKQFHEEGGVPGTFDDVKVMTWVIRMMRGPQQPDDPNSAVLMAMDGDELAGVLPLWEQGYWFNDADRFLIDKGFYVLPKFRNGEAAKLLLDAGISASEASGLPLYITIFNGRRRRGGRSEFERLGATLGYTPRGAVLAHFPENADVLR